MRLSGPKSAVSRTIDREATLHADLDAPSTAVYRRTMTLLTTPLSNAHRRVTDAEVVMLCVAEAIMGIRATGAYSPWPPSDLAPGSKIPMSHSTVSARRRRRL